MAAHRYWRAVAMEAYGTGDLELSCFHLLNVSGARVDAPATLTASAAPATGAVANLKDDDLTTAARWSVQSLAGLTLNWDFGGSPVDVMLPRLAGAALPRFLLSAGLQWSDDGATWVESSVVNGVTWPGPLAVTSSVTVYGAWSRTDKSPINVSISTLGDVSTTSAQCFARGSNGRSAGVLQFEVTALERPGSVSVGVVTSAASLASFVGGSVGGWAYESAGTKIAAGVRSAYGAAHAVGDVVGVVVNFSTGTLTFYKNGVSQGVAYATGLAGLTLYPAASDQTGSAAPNRFLLVETNFAYPVAGASPWGASITTVVSNLAGRASSLDPLTLGTGPTLNYGSPQLNEHTVLTVQSGFRDYTTGVLGTGRGRVAGTVKEKGTPDAPVYRKVRLIREIDGLLMRELWSHPVTGAYSFDFIDELQKFTVLSYDHTGAFRAVVASGITPELIP